jgi:hypothetical protein
MAYATADDVETSLGRSLTSAEADQVDGWLTDAALLIDGEGYTYTGTVPTVFERVSVNMVIRALRADGVVAPGAASNQWQAGPYGGTVTFTQQASSGGVWLSAADRMMLRPYRGASGMTSVTLGSERYIEPTV